MPKKLTLEEATKCFTCRGLKLLTSEYFNTKTRMPCVDIEGYKYMLCVNDINDKRTKSFERFSSINPYTIENLKLFIQQNNLSCELLSTKPPKHEKDKLLFRCRCGNKYWLHFNHFLSYKKDKCTTCSHRTHKIIHTDEELQTNLSQYGCKLIGHHAPKLTEIDIEDDSGYRYRTSLYRINQNNFGAKFHKLNPYTIYNMKLYIKLNDIPTNILDEDSRQIAVGRDYINIACSICGGAFSVLWEQLIRNRRTVCPHCTKQQSMLERAVQEYLEYKNILFISQKRFKGCKYKRMLPFDFYLPKYNCVIEVHGAQHYYENGWFPQRLKTRQMIDNIKKQYCLSHGIQYFEIPFWYIRNNGWKETYKKYIDNIIG